MKDEKVEDEIVVTFSVAKLPLNVTSSIVVKFIRCVVASACSVEMLAVVGATEITSLVKVTLCKCPH